MQATDGELGHVEDFLVDDLDWALRYIVVDTSNWWFGRHVLSPPNWIREVNWTDRHVAVDVDRDTVKAAPEFDSVEHVNRQWEAAHAHYKRPGYWISARTPVEAAGGLGVNRTAADDHATDDHLTSHV